jgi:hypothetical protein
MKLLFLFNFWLRLTVSCVFLYFAHNYSICFLGVGSEESLLLESYCANYGLAIFIFGALCLLRKRFNDHLGFLFLYGSFAKFAVFFVFFYPFYQGDGHMNRQEFLEFFIPYLVCLSIGTYYVSLLLNLPAKEK